MAVRRSFQTSGDNTPMMRPAERLPLRNLQNETLGLKFSTFSATKPISSIGLKNKGKMAEFQAETQTPALASSIRQRQLAHGCTRDTWSPVGDRGSGLFMGNLESPLPLLNSTLITSILMSVAGTPHVRETNAGVLAPPAENALGTTAGILQELLESQAPGDLADTPIGPQQEQWGPQAPTNMAGTQAGPLQPPGDLAGTQSGPLQEQLRHMGELLLRASKNMVPAVEHHSTSTGTRPVQVTEHGVNTSGLFECKREFSVAEASTSTDSLLSNLAPESLAELSRQDLEQRLFSTLIVVEALCQQVASARAHSQSSGPRPSDLRDKLVQTDHTELSQGMIYRELYVKAVERIQALELDQDHQRRLLQELKNSSITMTAITTQNEEALSTVNEIATIASEDQERISEQMCRMRGLYGRFREALRRKIEESTQLCTQKKNMEQQMEEALRVKEAALAMLEQLRSRHAVQVAELEQSVGSHLELIPVLSSTYQEQVALNEEYVESLQAADELLKETMCDQSRMYEELNKAQRLLQRTWPVMTKLHEKATAALQARNQQQQETNQMQNELEQSTSHLYDAQKQIGDLNLQLTIVTSEMAVLRQRLGELEEERAQAEMRSTKLSATLSSTQASCTYLEQALNAETHRLEVMLGESSQHVEELGRALGERELQLTQAQRHLQELQRQLSNTCEINEFLQTENELSREQVAESEVLVKSHLQGLRERNLECEDLKQELCELQLQRDSLQEELFSTQTKARSMLLDMGEQLALASTEIILLHHKVHTLTSAIKTTLTTQKPESSSKKVNRLPTAPPRHTDGSFVDSIIVAIAVEEAPTSETEECESAGFGSGNSAFTRVPTTTPMKDAEEQSDVLELLSGLGEAVSELVHTVDQLRELRQSQCNELQHTVASLREELHSLAVGHRSQVADLKKQLTDFQAKVEKDAVALQHKAQEEETLRELQKSENKELRRNVSELQNSLQQAQLEVQILKEECSQSAQHMPALEEKIRLQKEVDKLKRNLSETEDSRSKLLERAKRYQVVHETNQRKLERELQVLDQMIETVRKTLSSLPLVVKDCKELEHLVAYLG
ncbi:hypothetical protein AAFF_G00135360 [Aldrovandia affinis]|uniref:Sperm-associated antigen 5 n=1 Tax=Aldrovandia affinis TaxID=143900 RepID=A0AAD7W9D7_9TELE|nr:hypothetical protein AAFF_G00135360 [Aldrovandia affinis]